MANIGKKILSAFVEVKEERKFSPPPATEPEHEKRESYPASAASNPKFGQYFDKLFSESNLPGPDYYEYSKMLAALDTSGIGDEKTKYTVAFAGLSVQGLDKNKLLSTAAEYLRMLNTDAANFNSTVDAALQEKVQAKQQEMEAKTELIEQLSKQINALHQQIATLTAEIRENEAKIENNSGAYKTESEKMRARIMDDIEKIKQYVN